MASAFPFVKPGYIAATLMLSLATLPAFAQNRVHFSRVEHDRYTKFHNYYKAEGICSYQFTDIFQDSRGFMWFATRDGLMRFDGYFFETFSMGAEPNTLPHNDVRKLVEDSTGRLWVATMGGLCHFNPKTNDFTKVSQFFGKPLQGGKGVYALFVD